MGGGGEAFFSQDQPVGSPVNITHGQYAFREHPLYVVNDLFLTDSGGSRQVGEEDGLLPADGPQIEPTPPCPAGTAQSGEHGEQSGAGKAQDGEPTCEVVKALLPNGGYKPDGKYEAHDTANGGHQLTVFQLA